MEDINTLIALTFQPLYRSTTIAIILSQLNFYIGTQY